MERRKINVVAGLIVMAILLLLPLAAAAGSTTIEGEVNDSYQIVASDGQVYEVTDTTEGNDLVENHMGEKVKVTGTVEQDGDTKVITITTFQVIEE
jgi:Neuraminidase (sialidase)